MSCFVYIHGMQDHIWGSINKITDVFYSYGEVRMITKMSGSHLVLELDSFLTAKKGQFHLQKINWDKDNNTTIHVDSTLLSEMQKICNSIVFSSLT